MTTWSKDELHKIAQADDLHISPFRDDGVTYGTPTWIWSVALDDGPLRARLQGAELSQGSRLQVLAIHFHIAIYSRLARGPEIRHFSVSGLRLRPLQGLKKLPDRFALARLHH